MKTVRQHFVDSSGLQVETMSKREEIPSVCKLRFSDFRMHLSMLIHRIVKSDIVQYNTRLLYST